MGRPVRYGGEIAAFEERVALHDRASPRARWRRSCPRPKPGFRRFIAREPLGVVLVIAPWNYPYLTAVNSDRAGADGRQRRAPQARRADAAGRRALPGGDGPRRPARGPVPAPRRSATTTPTQHHRSAAGRSRRLHRLGRGRARRSSGRRPAPSRASGSSSAARTRPMCAPTPTSTHAVENLVDGAFFNSGQCCCGIERIYVHAERLRPLRRRLRRRSTRQYVLGDPLDQTTTLGPMAQPRFAETVRDQIAEARGARARRR